MPYIDKKRRKEIWELAQDPENAGELNFYLTRIILRYLPDKPRYKDYNEVMGVIESMKMELYRKRIAIYEQEKCKENGEVY